MVKDHGTIGGKFQAEMVPQLYEACEDGVLSLPQPKDGGEMNFLELVTWRSGMLSGCPERYLATWPLVDNLAKSSPQSKSSSGGNFIRRGFYPSLVAPTRNANDNCLALLSNKSWGVDGWCKQVMMACLVGLTHVGALMNVRPFIYKWQKQPWYAKRDLILSVEVNISWPSSSLLNRSPFHTAYSFILFIQELLNLLRCGFFSPRLLCSALVLVI